MYKILVVEDDLDMQQLIYAFLKQSGMEATMTESPLKALSLLKEKEFDLAILDLMLPEMDGLELCKKIRAFSNIPIIISSARGDISSKLLGFETGADDYLAKSYEPIELVARIHALLKRTQKDEILVFGDLQIDLTKHKVSLKNEVLDLTPAEFEILALLSSKKGKPFSRESLAQSISTISEDTSLRSIDTHIRNLRAKLNDHAKNPKYIQSVWGIGYKFAD